MDSVLLLATYIRPLNYIKLGIFYSFLIYRFIMTTNSWARRTFGNVAGVLNEAYCLIPVLHYLTRKIVGMMVYPNVLPIDLGLPTLSLCHCRKAFH